MDDNEIHLEAGATASASALSLRPWRLEDAVGLAEVYGDPAMRRWSSVTIADEADAVRWVRVQREGWESGKRLAFAVLETRSGDGEGRLAGHVVLKTPHGPSPEVGYWTAAHARGRGVASRALGALTDWAFTAFAGLTRLTLLHQVDNLASCRVAEKTGYGYDGLLLAAPPEFPLDGHLHVRVRGR
ncbi:GNAT family N-acetyltransferase [Streptomyces aurantiogriseus]|uniref:Acetyltransferase n=1 Tax=Streptomyces aurantiogriseus TaxID=66870 RepID=A0A918FN22_9ACTN|nr:GNAT family N-acetyltransferase [Streptomyces aurantiogriseus]GGR57917.1 acetyltransferase [Streptomyces aurantiogriseus]